MILILILLLIIIYFIINKKKEFFDNNFEENKINSFNLQNDRFLFFDIFHKNNELYLILPVYSNDLYFIDKIQIINNGKKLKLIKKITKIRYEPIIILIYDMLSYESHNYVTVQYINLLKTFKLTNLSTVKEYKLTLTTLFKYDYDLFNLFYKYYKKQGVEHFYLYYNGISNDDIKYLLNKSDVTLIDWNFRYWNDNSCKYIHHAQLGQLHHALYRYGKNMSEYMIYCDFDEYLFIPHRKLVHLLYDNKDTYGFCNVWSQTFSDSIPDELPDSFKISNKLNFKVRSKCIHKVNTIETLSIHYGSSYNICNPNIDTNNIMYHFFNFNKIYRVAEYNIVNTINIKEKKKELLFIHIPKTGGTTIERSFLANGFNVGIYNTDFYKSSIYKSNEYDNKNIIIKNDRIELECSFWHVPYKYDNYINFNNYITFTVVRNPYSRLLSEYNWREFGKFYKLDPNTENINEFIDSFLNNGEISYDGDCHLVPQNEYIYDYYGNKVENILKQETLDEDILKFIEKYNLDIKYSHEVYNSQKSKNLQISDLTDKSIQTINKYYKLDFDMFNYN